MNAIALTARQLRYVNRSFWRNPQAAFFTFVFPLMFLVIFDLLFGDQVSDYYPEDVGIMTYYVPAIVAFSVITACFTNISISVAIARDQGELKRLRGTPLPPASYLASRVLHATFISVLLVLVVVLAGTLLYDVDPPTSTIPAFLVAIVVGAATFSALGLAVSALAPNAEAAPAVAQAIILPLLFISGILIPLSEAPKWLTTVADVFPIKHYAEAMLTAFDPFAEGSGFAWKDLAVVGAWGVAGLLASIRFFTWEPRK
jgi:ABC-2 type transport system permease protein